jgi:hypothetical protein
MITSKQAQEACGGPIPIPKVKYLILTYFTAWFTF